jgi:ribosomal protein S1
VDEAFRIGQVVKCIVLQKTLPASKQKNAKAKLLLGLDIGDTSSILKDEREENTPKKAAAGNADVSTSSTTDIPIVSGTVISRDADKLEVRLSDGSLGILHSDQICDIASFGEKVVRSNAYAVGKSIDHAIVINSGKTGKTNTVTISTKPLFLAAAGVVSPLEERFSTRVSDSMSIPSKIADLAPGLIVVGYIWKVESYGVLVKFRDGMTALAPRPNVADTFISSPVGLFEVGDAVRCVVQRVDLSRDRAIVNLKPLMVPPSTGNASYVQSYLKSTFSATVAASEDVSSQQAAVPDWKTYPIGSVVKCTVVSIKDYGTVMMCADNVTVALCRSTGSGKSLSEGDTVTALVLDIDFKSGSLDVTLDSNDVTSAQQALLKASKKSKKKGANAENGVSVPVAGKTMVAGDICDSAKIVLVKDRYVIAILTSGVVCFVMVADYHCPYQETAPFTVDSVISVRVERVLTSDMVTADESTPFDHVTIGSVYTEESDRVRKQVNIA